MSEMTVGRVAFTPGPWLCEEIDPNDEIQIRTRGLIVASVWGGVGRIDDITEDVMRSNARLIAAAPELLAACKALVQLWFDSGVGPCDEDDCACVDHLVRAAIAKAEATHVAP